MLKVQLCYIGIHMPWWLAAPINYRFYAPHALGICPNALSPLPLTPRQAPVCDILQSVMRTCVLIVQLPLMSENMQFGFLFLC